MRLSQKTLKQRFKKFNEMYFNNELPEVPKFKVGGSKNIAGEFLAKLYVNWDDDEEKYIEAMDKMTIYLSKRLLRDSHILDEILLHEMIHYYGYFMNFNIDGTHNEWFMEYAEKINKDGYNIGEYYDYD